MTNKENIHKNLSELLCNRGWKIVVQTHKFDVYKPPLELNFDEDYKLYIYKQYKNYDYDKMVAKYLEIIADIYNEDVDELVSIVVNDSQILSIHIDMDSEFEGKPNINLFDVLIHKSKEIFREAANFSVIKKPHYFDKTEEAERYLNYCVFVKNEEGSLITRIQLPNKEEIKEKTIFENAITGSDINKNMMKIIEFINDKVMLPDNFVPGDDFLIANQECLSINFTNKLKDLYLGVELSDIKFSLKGSDVNLSTEAKNISRIKINNLNVFSKTVREKMKEIAEDSVYGKIIELKSRDVESDNNMISVEGEVKKVKSKISLHLDSEQIKLAADSFKNNKSVLINGIFEKEKSQYKVTELKQFYQASD